MKIAIIGAGLAGLGVSHFLLQSENVEVTLFDEVGIGGGASGVCSGLLHPYPGLSARRSAHAEEALGIARELIQVAESHTTQIVARQNGIVRLAQNQEQRERLLLHSEEYKDIEPIDTDRFLIHSGITVSLKGYLEGLWRSLELKGARLEMEKIITLSSLGGFDHIIVAAGWGVRDFFSPKELRVKFLKGQSLTLRGVPPFERSFISKGYIAHLGCMKEFEVGSTYEREFLDDKPNPALAQKLLKANLSTYGNRGIIVDCRAGVRVLGLDQYLPIVKQMRETLHVFTGLGSRGLLYHGYFGRLLAHQILSKNQAFF